ncbi:MAG: hypothetical protein K2P93_07395 [Alphaproteobacteria bacterium]|nr:hypothetical protein [Alphaproteobacteria bacterium]
MNEKLILYLTDTEIFLFKKGEQHTFILKENVSEIQDILKNILSSFPKTSLYFLVDLNRLNIQEEKLPPLFFWDRYFFLRHKRAEYSPEKGYAGFQFFKDKKETYFRWVHFPEQDHLSAWISWVTSFKNTLKGVFFVPIEAGGFLDKSLPSLKTYKMLIYPISSEKKRYVIFKGKRLLLSRPFQGEDDFTSSFHFLSRTYPDIHENLSVLNLEEEPSSVLPIATALSHMHVFLHYMVSLKYPSFSIRLSSATAWMRFSIFLVFFCTLGIGGTNIYQGFHFRYKSIDLFSQVKILKSFIQKHKIFLKNRDLIALRRAKDHYTFLKSHIKNPIELIEKISCLIKRNAIHLTEIKWQRRNQVELFLTFKMNDSSHTIIASQLDQLLNSSTEIFSGSQLSVIKAPFNSAFHETFKNPSESLFPIAAVKITFHEKK